MRCPLAVLVLLSAAVPAYAQDPVKVDPQHHKVEIENAHVRVLRITLGPGDKTPPHDHPASMAIFLTDARNRLSPAGGAVDESPRKRGDVVAVPGGKHTVENIGSERMEIVLVELKNPPMKQGKAVARDAATLDPKHYTVVAENDRARALRINYGPKEKSVMHDHPANVAVFLTGTKVMMHLPDGKSAEAAVERGGVQFSEAQSHQPETSSEGVQAVVVELKLAAR